MAWFTQDSLDFLRDIKEQNSKEWYAEHKNRFQEYVVSPLQELTGILSEEIVRIDPALETAPVLGKTISRIHRDTRFSKDKSLYKDRMWIMFKNPDRSKLDHPAFYFEFTPVSYRYGMGFYQATPKSMQVFRDLIDRDEHGLIEAAIPVLANPRLEPEGEFYKKSKYEGKRPEIKEWYNRKNIYITHNNTQVDKLFSRNIAEQVRNDYKDMEALYHYFKRVRI